MASGVTYVRRHIVCAFVCAMRMEAAPLLSLIEEKPLRPLKEMEPLLFEYAGSTHMLLISGIGMEKAGLAAELILNGFRPARIINFGIAGGVNPSFGRFYPVIASQIFMDGESPIYLPESAMITRLAEVNTPANIKVLTVPTPCDAPAKIALREKGIDAIDMEAYPIAKVANNSGIPFGYIRAISDMAEEKLYPPIRPIKEKAPYYLKNPLHIAGALRLKLACGKAASISAALVFLCLKAMNDKPEVRYRDSMTGK